MSISAYSQLQNWYANQANLNQQIYGNSSGEFSTDYGAAFANAEANFYGQKNSLAVTAMEMRQVQKAQAASKPASSKTTNSTSGTTTGSNSTATKTTADPALTAAKAAGNDILTSLGLISSPPTKTTPSSASGPYKPPTNTATGYAYVPTSAANIGDLGAANLLGGAVNLFV